MWLKCTLCKYTFYGSARDWGQPCPQKNCEGTLAYDTGFQAYFPTSSPNLLRRYFKCSYCKKIIPEGEMDRMNLRKCVRCGKVGGMSPI
ncbi:MAG: hypothetical protein PHU88_01785 [candidate division Zixibacteria bacterium]|nr:hypothetical protein [candidate division Zixibacteria bacterium]MDD5426291.1 hypothetical protein [candidate division Zixibacteria bacterium]